jgi:tRNA-dihydrouridine synthase
MAELSAVYFAPFQGITTHIFRKVYAKHFQGVDKLYTPYFSNFEPGHALSAVKMRSLQNRAESGIEVVPQVLSKSAEEILWLAQVCEQLGFRELNWNLGCPYPQVANKKRGSGMLPYPGMVDAILEQVMKSTGIRFSVKCRLGYYSADEAEALLPVFNRYPISELTIHPRIGKQLYSGEADMEAFARISEGLTMPLAYNGDIFSVSDYLRFRTISPETTTLMLGRGLLRDPFLAGLLKGIAQPQNPGEVIREFTEELYQSYRYDRNDNPSVLNALKEYWAYLSFSFDEPVKVFRKIRKSGNFADYEEAIRLIFNEYRWIGSMQATRLSDPDRSHGN